ncbi:MAG: restriction endonuclease subunit S [ANME-2 cluster archaeon]|nr:restriction endonuclease subunit S [ANME-2 cluster archaeon]
MKNACEGKLVPTEAELARAEGRDYEPADVLLERILEERREKWNGKGKYKEPEAPDTTGFSELPEGWVWTNADRLTTVITDGEHITPERSESGILLLSARNIRNGKLSLEKVDYVPQHVYDKISNRLKIEPGDVLLSCSGSVGRSCVSPNGLIFTLVRSVAVLKPVIENGNYISYCLRSSILQKQINEKKTQTAQSNIFQGKIRKLLFPLPPLAEQRRIVVEVERRLSICDKMEETIAESLQKAESLRQSILKKAFEGKLLNEKELEEVRNAPDWEPAEKLLERIKAEKTNIITKKKDVK